jgi:hypothetical protein
VKRAFRGLRVSSAVVERGLTAKLVAAMAISSVTTLRLRDRPWIAQPLSRTRSPTRARHLGGSHQQSVEPLIIDDGIVNQGMYTPRHLEPKLRKLLKAFPCVVVSGARQVVEKTK